MQKLLKTIAGLNILTGTIIFLVSIFILVVFLNNPINSTFSTLYNADFESQILGENIMSTSLTSSRDEWNYLINPQKVVLNIPKDTAVTNNFTIKIASIGLDTLIWESMDSKKALDKGVWRNPQNGRPDENYLPVVLSAHRWGYDNYTDEYRRKNLFLNLTNINTGDIILINWNNKEYRYKVQNTTVGAVIDQKADLILITCTHYDSLERFIVFANKV